MQIIKRFQFSDGNSDKMSIYVLLYIWRKLFTCSCVHRSNVSFFNFVVKTVDRHLKALVNEDLLRTHILLPMMFLGQHKLGNVCCGHKMFLNKIRNIFCPGHKFLSTTNVAARGQTGKYLCRQQCVRNSVSATVCPQQCVLVCQGLSGYGKESFEHWEAGIWWSSW